MDNGKAVTAPKHSKTSNCIHENHRRTEKPVDEETHRLIKQQKQLKDKPNKKKTAENASTHSSNQPTGNQVTKSKNKHNATKHTIVFDINAYTYLFAYSQRWKLIERAH